jgi:hypothetical protein
MTDRNSSEAEHPSPHRGAASLVPLFYGLMAAPLAWVVGQIASATLAQEACFPRTELLTSPAFEGVQVWNAAILGSALIICLSAVFVAAIAWSRTKHERTGDHHNLLEIGEGRSRFMALAGIITSVGFMVATLFSAPALFFVAPC